jgi:hypothetical protein
MAFKRYCAALLQLSVCCTGAALYSAIAAQLLHFELSVWHVGDCRISSVCPPHPELCSTAAVPQLCSAVQLLLLLLLLQLLYTTISDCDRTCLLPNCHILDVHCYKPPVASLQAWKLQNFWWATRCLVAPTWRPLIVVC